MSPAAVRARWEESAQNVLTTLSQELADMERELANCKRDLAIMVGMADNEERATERAERAESDLAECMAHAEAMADAKHVYDWETHAAAYRAAIVYVSASHPGIVQFIEVERKELDRGFRMLEGILYVWRAKHDYDPRG